MEFAPFSPRIKRVAFIGNYLPRQCGIATFTADLCESIAAEYPDMQCLALPVRERDSGESRYEQAPILNARLNQ